MQTNVIANKMVGRQNYIELLLLHQLKLISSAHSFSFDITLATHSISCHTSDFFLYLSCTS